MMLAATDGSARARRPYEAIYALVEFDVDPVGRLTTSGVLQEPDYASCDRPAARVGQLKLVPKTLRRGVGRASRRVRCRVRRRSEEPEVREGLRRKPDYRTDAFVRGERPEVEKAELKWAAWIGFRPRRR